VLDPVFAKGMPTQSRRERKADVTFALTVANQGLESYESEMALGSGLVWWREREQERKYGVLEVSTVGGC
jgi:hypothetical protein